MAAFLNEKTQLFLISPKVSIQPKVLILPKLPDIALFSGKKLLAVYSAPVVKYGNQSEHYWRAIKFHLDFLLIYNEKFSIL